MALLRGLGSRAEQALDAVSQRLAQGRDRSGSWLKAAELELGSAGIDPSAPDADICSGDLDILRVYAESDRNDTIPSPPPELESAPWQDER
jgi:hypothetical protein